MNILTMLFCLYLGMRSGVGIRRNGGMAEYCKVPDYQLHPLPEGVNDDMGNVGHLGL